MLVADKELDEDEEDVPDVISVLLLLCDVEEIMDEDRELQNYVISNPFLFRAAGR